ncbi:MAG: T9SS type A sorting domain-containing protein [Calditrichia bacterium]
MKIFSSLVLIIFALLFSPLQNLPAQTTPFGLEDKSITALSFVPDIYLSTAKGYMYASTESSGIFRRNLDSPDSQWISIGLKEKKITTLYTYHWGAGPAQLITIFAGVAPHPASGDSVLLYYYQLGSTTGWLPSKTGLKAHASGDSVKCIGGFFFSGHMPPEPVFLATPDTLYKSFGMPTSLVWEGILDTVTVNTVRILQGIISISPQIIWIGGENSANKPFLANSYNKGNTWNFSYPEVNNENACYAIAINPDHPDTVYAGLQGSVVKTVDGGKKWMPAPLANVPEKFTSIIIDPTDFQHLLAGGESAENKAGLYESHDGGNNWVNVTPGTGLRGISGMYADTSDNKLTVYIGTRGSGIYRYQTPLTNFNTDEKGEIPKDFKLYQNYPNPFNTQTVIRYYLPRESFVKIGLFDVLGHELREIVHGKKEAGLHSLSWDGSGETSGIYFIRLEANGKILDLKKMILLK